ncbi:MAG: helix-turn-helix domain-containing protein [Acidimicrobiia bacterium]|nr:helix-turn-helix domain-containing protein [Acidimicrobiia bacterium]
MATSSADYPQVLDTAMVADMLGMNVQVVRRMAREGTIPAYRLPGGRSFRFFRDEVLDWLKSFPVQSDAEIGVSQDISVAD